MSSQSDFEDQYLDVLQNLEFGIVRVYQETPDLTDYEVQSALDALLKAYKGEARGHQPRPPRNPLAIQVYESVFSVSQLSFYAAECLDL